VLKNNGKNQRGQISINQMLNNEVKKNIRIKITIKRIRTLFEKKKKKREDNLRFLIELES
jgi:hypothetical protein